MTEGWFDADTIRGLVVSLSALVIGMIVAASWTAWRHRLSPPPQPPMWLIGLCAGGFSLLVVSVGLDRWNAVGSGVMLRPQSIVSLGALILTAFAMALLLARTNRQ